MHVEYATALKNCLHRRHVDVGVGLVGIVCLKASFNANQTCFFFFNKHMAEIFGIISTVFDI